MTARLPFILAVALLGTALSAREDKAFVLPVTGAISPPTSGYLARGITEAEIADASVVIVRLDTPGGLLDSTKEIVQTIYQSRVPVVVYVAPPGAGAISAGCFITLAADVAAMAPNTTIGAAHPVSLGGGTEKLDPAMAQKLENFAVSYIEAIAQKRGRNVAWAKSAVQESAAITAEAALKAGVIEIIATDLPDLLRQLDGRVVHNTTLATAAATVQELPMNFREQLFHLAWRPEVLMILMLVAIYGIIGEISNPGAIIPGVIGVVALIMALYLSAALPINVAGLVLIFVGVALFVAEAFTPTTGLLTGGGVVAFFFGFLLLFDRADPVFRLSLRMIIPATVLTAAFFLFVVGAGLRALRLPVKVGRETLVGRQTRAVAAISAGAGKVFVEGEYWNAVSPSPIAAGQRVEVVAVDGLTLTVKAVGPDGETFPPSAVRNPTSEPGRRHEHT